MNVPNSFSEAPFHYRTTGEDFEMRIAEEPEKLGTSILLSGFLCMHLPLSPCLTALN